MFAEEYIESPFATGAQLGKPKLPLTDESVELVLDELRPYLQKHGGDCKVVEIEGPILRLEMQGACGSCASSAITIKQGIEATMLDRIPEIFEVEAIMPGFKEPTEEGVHLVIESISPFLSVSGGAIELVEFTPAEDSRTQASIVMAISGPPKSNQSIKAEVLKRVRSMYGRAHVELITEDELG